MAGLIAANPNNSKCSTGIAYDVNLGHIRIIDDEGEFISNLRKSKAFTFASQKIDIYVLGYGSLFLRFGRYKNAYLRKIFFNLHVY